MGGIARLEMELYNLYLLLIPEICHHLEGSDFTKRYSTLVENLINLWYKCCSFFVTVA